MAATRTERPIFFVFAGPNGSGKSSIYSGVSIEDVGHSIWIINPDLLTARIREVEGLDAKDANLAAVVRVEAWLDASIDAHQTVGVETVLSTSKYRRLVEKAKQRQFEFRLVYVLLDSPQRNIERVKMRVAKGGHAVPEQKIIDRYARSLEQLPWFLEHADRAWVFDNSAADPKLIAEKRDGLIRVDEGALPVVIEAARRTQRG